ncbi:MAG: RTX toxin, partial [Acidobacteriota bacterium]
MQQDPTPTRSVACFRLTVPERGWLFGLALVLASYAIDVSAQSTAAWRPEGPAPNTLGQTENVVPDDEVSGAVNAVVTHPTNADILWIGAVNGGIWRTDNATATSPTWVRQTDLQRSLSIGALALDPSDATHNTLIAGVGIFSSLGFDKGGDRSGLLRTTNGGATWTSIGADLITSNITGVVVDDNVIVASADFSNPNIFSQVGLFRSTDFGATFTQISGAAGTGLDAAQVLDLAQDPINRNRLFVSTRFSQAAGGDGIFRSLDFGLTWERVSNGAIDGFLNANPVEIGRVEISVGRFGEVYVVVPINGVAVGLFRSANGGSNWVRMDTPRVHEGGQGGIHMSIAADPTDASIVYIGGDRQDLTQFPNAIGAFDFSGLLVRCDAQVAPGFQCVHLTHSRDLGPAGGGTLSSSAPHADSRELTFDAAGNLIDGNDGGVYKRTFPRSDTGDWFSIIGNLASAELHDIAYDSNSNTIIGGAQDTGTPAQPSSGASRWFSVATADGGDVAVDDTSTPGIAVRYSSFQNLGAFRRQTRNAANELLSEEFASLQVVSGPSLIVTFSQPYELNLVDPDRMLIHAFAAAYESFDRGDTLTAISVDAIFDNNRIGADPLAYGARNNPDIVYLSGTPDRIFVRTGPPGSAVVQSTSYPGTGSGRFIIDIALDPADGNDAFVVDDERVFRTVNAGASWSDITGNLRTLDPGRLRSNVFIENSLGDAIAVGTDRGVFMALASSGF